MHKRQAIRENIKTTLTGLAETGNRVYVNRVYPITQDIQSGIIIFNDNEQIKYLTMGTDRRQERVATYKVELYVKNNTGYDSKVDEICLQVEDALYQDATRGGYALDTMISNFSVDYNGDGDVPVGIGILDVVVKYHTTESSISVGA